MTDPDRIPMPGTLAERTADAELRAWFAAQESVTRAALDKAAREDAELDKLHCGGAVRDACVRAAHRRREAYRAHLLLQELRKRHLVYLEHGAARVFPPPGPDAARTVDELQPYLCDLLESEADGKPNVPALPEE